MMSKLRSTSTTIIPEALRYLPKFVGPFDLGKTNRILQYTWDESAFNTDREGEVNDAVPCQRSRSPFPKTTCLYYSIAFNIQGADEFPSSNHIKNAAPTRPPSRTNNRSPLGRLTDLQVSILLALKINADV